MTPFALSGLLTGITSVSFGLFVLLDECQSQDWQNLVFMFSGGRCLVLWRDVDQLDKNRTRRLTRVAFGIRFRSRMDCSSFLPFRMHVP